MYSVRYFKLSNDVGCIARMRILWKKDSASGEYKLPGDPDVLYNAERTIDLNVQTDIPSGARVELYVEIAVCKDQRANEEFIFDPECGQMVCYLLDGSITSNTLTRTSPKFYGE